MPKSKAQGSVSLGFVFITSTWSLAAGVGGRVPIVGHVTLGLAGRVVRLGVCPSDLADIKTVTNLWALFGPFGTLGRCA